MSNTGYRSIEVQITNNSPASLTLQSATLGSNCSWISGEQLKQGQVIQQYAMVVCGCYTDAAETSAFFYLVLTGLGATPVTIEAQNNAANRSSVIATGNSSITCRVQQLSATPEHSRYMVQLNRA